MHEEPTSGVESSTISHHNLESLTKPCKVVLEKCDKVSFQDKREVPLEKTIEKIQDTPDLDDRAENEKCIDELEPVTINSAVQSEILPATKVVKKTQRNKTNINQIKQ